MSLDKKAKKYSERCLDGFTPKEIAYNAFIDGYNDAMSTFAGHLGILHSHVDSLLRAALYEWRRN